MLIVLTDGLSVCACACASVYMNRYVGCSATAYFVGKCLAHVPLILLSPAVYLTFYYTFSAPRASMWQYYTVFALIEVRVLPASRSP